MRFVDKSGNLYGSLVPIYRAPNNNRNRVVWLCVCLRCKRHLEVSTNVLRPDRVKSCGCSQDNSSKVTHGLSRTSIFSAWRNMLQRCRNPEVPNYPNYGGRGILVCSEWLDVLTFKSWAIAAGWEQGLTIDRIDVNGNYEPSNCRWIPLTEQHSNKTNTVYVNFRGSSVPIAEVIRKYANPILVPHTIRRRVRDGWDIEEAITRPAGRWYKG